VYFAINVIAVVRVEFTTRTQVPPKNELIDSTGFYQGRWKDRKDLVGLPDKGRGVWNPLLDLKVHAIFPLDLTFPILCRKNGP
jgi:hypothetical protein